MQLSAQDGGYPPRTAGLLGAGESERTGSHRAAAHRGKGRGNRSGRRDTRGMAAPALEVGAEHHGAGDGPHMSAQSNARAAAGGERRMSATGHALLRPGRVLRACPAAARPQVWDTLVAGLRVSLGWRNDPAGRGSVQVSTELRGSALAGGGVLRGYAGRYAIRGAGLTQYVPHGTRRLRTGGRAVGCLD